MRLLVFLLLFASPLFADELDIRITDNNGDVLDIIGQNLRITQRNDQTNPASGRAQDIRISDNQGEVMGITSAGALTVREV